MSDIYEIGEGVRGCKDRYEFLFYNPNKVYMKCLACEYTWNISSFEWKTFIPVGCPNCSLDQISHSWIELNSIGHKWRPAEAQTKSVQISIELKSRYWVIKHDLGMTNITVQCMSQMNVMVIPDSVSFIDNNNLIVDFGLGNSYYGTCICYPIYEYRFMELKDIIDPIGKAFIRTLIRVKRN